MNMHVKTKAALRVGDRVKCIGEYERTFGKLGTLIRDDKSAFAPYLVAFLDWREGHGVNDNEWWLAADDVEAAPLFAVGDKVRVANNVSGRVSYVGRTGVIASDDFGYGDGTSFSVKLDGDGCSLIFSALELAPAYTSCAAAEVDNLADEYGGVKKAGEYKIGDRVRITDASRYRHNVVKVGDLATITDVVGTNYELDVDTDAEGTISQYGSGRTFEHVAVAPATATTASVSALTIRAGAYYKTRDGRKVGPMEKSSIDAWTGDGGRRLYRNDGQRYFACDRGGDSDLIAEWSDDVPLRGVSPVAQPIAKTVVAPATTAKFKVGDKVGCRTNAATTYVIRAVSGDYVDVSSLKADGTADSWNYRHYPATDFFHLPATPSTIADIVRKHSGTAIVCLIENGQPKPSTLPFVHLNKDAAATEANRLAGIHKGQEFGVYECVDVRKVERVYEHEWQRLAAGGQKINAIRELRGMTGLGLATTKGAVEDWLKREAA